MEWSSFLQDIFLYDKEYWCSWHPASHVLVREYRDYITEKVLNKEISISTRQERAHYLIIISLDRVEPCIIIKTCITRHINAQLDQCRYRQWLVIYLRTRVGLWCCIIHWARELFHHEIWEWRYNTRLTKWKRKASNCKQICQISFGSYQLTNINHRNWNHRPLPLLWINWIGISICSFIPVWIGNVRNIKYKQ